MATQLEGFENLQLNDKIILEIFTILLLSSFQPGSEKDFYKSHVATLLSTIFLFFEPDNTEILKSKNLLINFLLNTWFLVLTNYVLLMPSGNSVRNFRKFKMKVPNYFIHFYYLCINLI